MDVLQNVLLFLPLGAALALLGRSRLEATVVSALLSIVVELLQYYVVGGRDAAARDVVSNLAGGAAGHWLVASWMLLVRPSPARARMLMRNGALTWLAITCLTSWAMQRAPSRRPPFLVAHRPVCCYGHRTFQGTVLDATVAGQRLTAPAVVRDTLALARLPASEPLTAALTLTPGPATANSVLLFGVYDGRIGSELSFTQEHRVARFATRLRADAMRFRSPVLELRDALPERAGGSVVQLDASYDRGRVTMSATRGGQRGSTTIALGPALGWTMLSPVEVPAGSRSVVLNVLWLFGLTLPLGYWWAMTRSGSVVLGTVFVVGLAVVPRLLSVAPASPVDWTGVLGGLLLGTVLARQRSGTPPGELAAGGPAS